MGGRGDFGHLYSFREQPRAGVGGRRWGEALLWPEHPLLYDMISKSQQMLANALCPAMCFTHDIVYFLKIFYIFDRKRENTSKGNGRQREREKQACH